MFYREFLTAKSGVLNGAGVDVLKSDALFSYSICKYVAIN